METFRGTAAFRGAQFGNLCHAEDGLISEALLPHCRQGTLQWSRVLLLLQSHHCSMMTIALHIIIHRWMHVDGIVIKVWKWVLVHLIPRPPSSELAFSMDHIATSAVAKARTSD
jgi:hypothetical protein